MPPISYTSLYLFAVVQLHKGFKLTLPPEEKGFARLLIIDGNVDTDIMKKTWLARTPCTQWWKIVFSITCNDRTIIKKDH